MARKISDELRRKARKMTADSHRKTPMGFDETFRYVREIEDDSGHKPSEPKI